MGIDTELAAMIGRNLTRIIAEKEIEARSLAARLGVHESAISLWKSGTRVPRMENLRALAKELGVEVKDLWDGPSAVPTTPEIAALVEEAAKLSPAQVQALLATARLMRQP